MAHWSFCGLNCEECPVYQATQKQDQAHQVWLAAEYSSESYWYSPKEMTCQGCHSQQRLESKMCQGVRCATMLQSGPFPCAECAES